MRLGILGGSFDPPHVGHLLVAQDAVEALQLNRLMVVPAATQPLKRSHTTSAQHRLAMAVHCFGGVAGMFVDPVEIDRGGLSYMVDTVEHFGREFPSAEIHLLVGADVVDSLPRWRDIDRLLNMVRLVVMRRDLPVSDKSSTAASPQLIGNIVELNTRVVDVSSTEIRTRIRDGLGIRGFVTDAVAEYIEPQGCISSST